MTPTEARLTDSIGITKFTVQQCKAMVDMLRRTGKLVSEPPECEGQGIVIAGGGKYLSWAWVVCRVIRSLGCKLPIQVWHIGKSEMPDWAVELFSALDAETVDVLGYLRIHPHRMLGQYISGKKWTYAGWVLKNYAIAHCPWEQVLFLDADCFPAVNPEILLNDPEIKRSGGLFFHDVANHAKGSWAWIYCSLTISDREWECGQYIVNKSTGWMGLRWSNWMNEHADTFFEMVHGDKTTTELGFKVSEVPILVSGECSWEGWGILHRWKGKEVFRHAMGFKRGEGSAPTPQISDLFWEWEKVRQRP